MVDYKENSKTPVSDLKEYHDNFARGTELNGPTYDVMANGSIQTSGFLAICKYQSYKTEGFGKSKADAKREAASIMLMKLYNRTTTSSIKYSVQCDTKSKSNDIPKICLTSTQKKNIAAFIEKYQATEEVLKVNLTNYTKIKDNLLQDINLGLKDVDAPKSITLETRRSDYSDPVNYFITVMEEMGLKFCCTLPDVKSEKANLIYVTYICIDFNLLMVGGYGSSKEEAIWNACENAINMLLILIE